MVDVEPLIERSFARLHPTPAVQADWADVIARAGVRAPAPHRRRRLLTAGVLAAAAAVLAATPLGAAIGRGLWSFPAWLAGSAGQPASPSAQQAFARENARSWTGFPSGTELRELIRTHADGIDYVLYGFRSGDSLCLQLVLTGALEAKSQACAPLADLRSRPQPALVLQVDAGFGTIPGAHVKVGLDTYGAARASASFGIVADAVRRVELRSDDATREAIVDGDAFLSVVPRPQTSARVRRITATVADGRTYALPLATAPFGTTGGASAPAGTLHGPSQVERVLHGGTIGWVERREARGEPLPDGFPNDLHGVTAHRVLGRLLQPDPSDPLRVAVALYDVVSAPAYTFLKPGLVLCSDSVVGRAAGGGCGPLATYFEHGPFSFGVMTLQGGDQYSLVDGLASDDVASLRLFLGDGGVEPVPLRDNAFALRVSRARFPIRMVGYDAQGRVIGIQSMQGEGSSPAWSKHDPAAPWTQLLRILDADGNPATLSTSRSLGGTTCWAVRMQGGGGGNGCLPPTPQRPALQLGYLGDPRFTAVLEGRVRDDVVRLRLSRRSGAVQTVAPTDGFVLVAVPHGDPFVEVTGYDASGAQVGSYEPLNP